MNRHGNTVYIWLPILLIILSISLAGPGVTPAKAQEEDPLERPFRLPFEEPPGPDTWLLAQPYGNTTGAYFQRYTTYGASGGIHFGMDLSAPCGTEIVAIADGVVFAVDGPFGSPPHNLMIDHPELGYASMYGHLLEAPVLEPGEEVNAGQVVALVGDSQEDCNRSPHVHLEIRDMNHIRKFNPATLIEADWNRLALYGSGGRDFMRNLDQPRQWQNLYDQPEAQTGGPIVNDFARTWPMDWEPHARQSQPAAPTPTPVPTPTLAPPQPETAALAVPPQVRQITGGDCCTNPYWNEESTQVRFIDRPAPVAEDAGPTPVGIWGVDISTASPMPELVTNRLAVYSWDRSLIAYPDRDRGLAVIERLADGRTWTLDTQGESVSFTPDGQLLWTVHDREVSWRARQGEIWLAEADGSNARRFVVISRGGPAAWLSDTELLITSRVPPSQDTLLSILSLEDGNLTQLAQIPRLRSGALSPEKRYLVYNVRHHADPRKNGLWLLDLRATNPEPEQLPFFGAYRWRDEQHLVYIPFEPEASEIVFREYDLRTGQSRRLFPAADQSLDLAIANNDWRVSPDGSKIALVAAKGTEMDGIWVIDIGDEGSQ